MDMWVVAAAAGAGYLAKYWQRVSSDKESVSEFTGSGESESLLDEAQCSSFIDRILDKTCLRKNLLRRNDHSGEILSETSSGDDPSYRALNYEQEVGRYDDKEGYGMDIDMSSIPEDSAWEVGAPSKKSRKSRRLNLQCIKPRNSLDSCLLAQMQRENIELEQYLLTPLSSPCTPSLRPFIVSDGKRIISRPSGDLMSGLYPKVHARVDNTVVGVPRLPQINTVDRSKEKSNLKNQMGKSKYDTNVMQFNTQAGFSSGKALFCLGISIGILSTIIANKVELEKMKVTLKQSENLVEDLQEELEMKDSLTVKEIVNDDISQDIHGILSDNEKTDVNVFIRYGDENSERQRKDDSISNIEAELEAELERLELSMKGSTLSTELDQGFEQDIIAELVCGELQADIVRRRSSSELSIDRGSESLSTPHSTKDGVSPRQLSLRLHEVIQSRLEERILELEVELGKSQNQVKQLLSERTNYSRNNSNSRSSSARCSPRATQPNSQPLVMNLSGDALDAYNEAFEELNKIKRSDDSPFASSRSERVGKREEAVPISITGIPSSEDSPNDDDDYDDDMLLIMQIVEKARQGSPAILKAQNAMVSLTRNC